MKRNELRFGVVMSYVNLALSTLIPLLYTPIMLKILGQAEYGLYSLALSTVSYLSLLNLGLGNTINRYIAKYRAENDTESKEKTFGFFIILYCVLAGIVLFCGWLISNNINFIFEKTLTTEEVLKMKSLVMIMTISTAVSFPTTVFTAVIGSHEKYVFRTLLETAQKLITPCANLAVLFLGAGAIGLSAVAAVIQIVVLPVNIIYCIKSLKVKPRLGWLQKDLIKEMVVFTAFIFLGSLVDMLFWSTDKLILGMLVGSTAVAVYNIGGTFNNIVMSLSSAISGVLGPRITGMVVTDASKEELTEIFIRVGRLQYIVLALILSGFTVFGQFFIHLWVGPEYKDAFWVAILTMYPLAIPLIQNTGLSIIVAQNKHRFRAIVFFIIAVLNVVSTYICVPYFGIVGAAFCSCVSYLLGQGLTMNIYYYKVTKLDIPLFWRNILKMSPIPVVMTVLGLYLNKIVQVDNWIMLFSMIIGYSAVYAILMHCFCLNEYEKSLYLPILKRIWSRIYRRS